MATSKGAESDVSAESQNRERTLVTGVIGADTHIVGNRILTMALEEAGFTVVALGALTPADEFIKAAIETAADGIMVSSLYGQGELDCRGFREMCIEAGLGGILLYVGGNLVVGKQDWAGVERRFLDMGFDRAFPPGTRAVELPRDILERKNQLSEREEIEQRLHEIDHKIELYRTHGFVEKLREATTLTTDEQRLSGAEDTLKSAVQAWKEAAEDWETRWGNHVRELGSGESSQKAILTEASQIFERLREEFIVLFQGGKTQLTAALEQLERIQGAWKQARQPLDEEIRKIKQELGDAVLDPDELIRLTGEQARLRPKLKALDELQTEVDSLFEQRQEYLVQLREARREVCRIRRAQARHITSQLQNRVQVTVVAGGQSEEFAEVLKNFFQGSRVDGRSLERIASVEAHIDGTEIAEKAKESAQALIDTFGLTPGRAEQIYGYLAEDEGRRFDLQMLAPEDAVQVSLKVNATFHPLEHLSDGQRATAMLLLLLVQADRLLLVDQPEDDLDNRFIYEDIVRILREQKGKRQLLAATHNPNIPVLGHAELIVALDAADEQAFISTQGAIDQKDIQEFVRNVMEGGEDAFRKRAQKYGWF